MGELTSKDTAFGRKLLKDFMFADDYVNLNQGSYGVIPRAVHETRLSYLAALEARPDPFLRQTFPKLLRESRTALAELLRAPLDAVVLVPNATTGVNTVLRSLRYAPGDVLVYFSCNYGACQKTILYLEESTPVKGHRVEVRYPVGDDEIVRSFRDAVAAIRREGRRPVAALFDVVVSMPGVRFPFEQMTQVCREEGVLSVVDGAHGVGMLDLDLGAALDPDFFVSNCHKWLFTPRGSCVMYASPRVHHLIRSTLPTSHGWQPLPNPNTNTNPNSNPTPEPALYDATASFSAPFELPGTTDPTPYLCVRAALAYRSTTLPGESAIHAHHVAFARAAGAALAQRLGTRVLSNAAHNASGLDTLGACAFSNVLLPLSSEKAREAGAKRLGRAVDAAAAGAGVLRWVSEEVLRVGGTFVAVVEYWGEWWVRLSGSVFLEVRDVVGVAGVLEDVCRRAEEGEWVEVLQEK
ncbi:pyridoxal phosphate-dependent transferase [Phyllosticta citrichinensis]|uniref:Pyridoxal phosphate-dependent transferase n=1 Tax=Phyllosticta citrichinensis TaxID=1130410 RepID=A0ABR1XLF4_9PEZI